MPIDLKTSGNVATITIDNPDRANVITHQTARELDSAWRVCQDDYNIRAVILTAVGSRHFSAGHDLRQPDNVSADDYGLIALERTFRPLSATVNGFRSGADPSMADHFPRITKPVIAAVNGMAVGAGLYMLLASTDIRIAARGNAGFKFGLVGRGWIGAGPSATLLLKQLRYVDAMRLLLQDPTIDADEAVRIGLINETVEPSELMPKAQAIAAQLAGLPVHAVRFIKEFAHSFSELPTEQAWRVQSLMNDLLLHNTADGTEGRDAFTERREPKWSGDYANTKARVSNLTDQKRKHLDELRREFNW